MNAAVDRLEDGFPHGTVEGFRQGCRGSICPAGADHGLSCRKANQLRAGDYRYQKLVKRGLSPAAIADELGLNPDPTAAPPKRRPSPPAEREPDPEPKPKPKPDVEPEAEPEPEPELPPEPAQPLAERSQDPSDVAPDIAAVDALEAPPEGEGMGPTTEQREPYTFAHFTGRMAPKFAREKSAEMRAWMRANGWPGLGNRGNVPQEAFAAYEAAHPTSTAVPDLVDDEPRGGGEPAPVGPPASEQESPGRTVPVVQTEAGLYIPEYLREIVDMGQRSDMLDEVRDRIADPAERHEWGRVAADADVEQARSLATRLLLDLTDVETERDRALAALELTLQKWDEISTRAIVLQLKLSIARSMAPHLRAALRAEEARAADLADRLALAEDRADLAETHLVRALAAEAERDRLRSLIDGSAVATRLRRWRLRRAAS